MKDREGLTPPPVVKDREGLTPPPVVMDRGGLTPPPVVKDREGLTPPPVVWSLPHAPPIDITKRDRLHYNFRCHDLWSA